MPRHENLLANYHLKVMTSYSVEIYFETEDEENLERDLINSARDRQADPDEVDWELTPGSPASSPYVTVTGTSRRLVEEEAGWFVKTLLGRGDQVSDSS